MSIELSIRFVKRLYGNPDGNFSIYAAEPASYKDSRLVKTDKRYGNFSVSGDFYLDNSEMGSIYTVTIEEDFASKYPNSYKLIKIHYELPKGAEEQWDYLRNSSIVPLGIYFAIENTFSKSEKILDLMMNEPKKLTKVKGIGDARAELYQNRLLENQDKAVIFAEYGDIEGVGASTINILVKWKPSVIETIKAIEKDPFSLLENPNIGFMLADRFRAHYDLPLNDRNRILHGVSYFLSEKFQNTGDTYEEIFPAAKSVAKKLLVSDREIILLLAEIQDDIDALKKYRLKIFGKNITTQDLFDAELLIYKKANQLSKDTKGITNKKKWAEIKEDLLASIPQSLSDEQSQFLDLINEKRISVLLGPGGSGKSWVVNLACQMIKKAGKTYGLFAPTARAAHVMGDYVGTEALTIHRGLMTTAMLGSVAPYDVLIVDEYSMVDSELASIVLKTIGANTRLIIIGDDFQLQSVGPGNVLFDLVEFVEVPTIRLTKIFRQSEGSGILDYASQLREGTFHLPLETKKVEHEDIVFINESDPTKQQETALSLYKKAYDKYGVEDVMLLSPTHKGVSGRNTLNKKVQEMINPSLRPNDVVFGANLSYEDKRYFKTNDYITVKKNNYDMVNDFDKVAQIINGDLGVVEYTNKNKLTFKIDRDSYTIDKSEIHELIDHAWTITIHKSQGGQASEVIIVLPKNSHFMLNSNMLYTAMTRAKIKCYIIGDFQDINKASKKQANFNRKTIIQLQKLNEKLANENKDN